MKSRERVCAGQDSRFTCNGLGDRKDNLGNIWRFERYATIADWQRDTWAVRPSRLITGKELNVNSVHLVRMFDTIRLSCEGSITELSFSQARISLEVQER